MISVADESFLHVTLDTNPTVADPAQTAEIPVVLTAFNGNTKNTLIFHNRADLVNNTTILHEQLKPSKANGYGTRLITNIPPIVVGGVDEFKVTIKKGTIVKSRCKSTQNKFRISSTFPDLSPQAVSSTTETTCTQKRSKKESSDPGLSGGADRRRLATRTDGSRQIHDHPEDGDSRRHDSRRRGLRGDLRALRHRTRPCRSRPIRPSAGEMAERIARAHRTHAWLVLREGDGDRPRGRLRLRRRRSHPAPAYRWACEVSVYLRAGAPARGCRPARSTRRCFARLAERGFRDAVAPA